MKSKLCTREEIISKFHDGQTIAIGGFGSGGVPTRLIDCLVESGAKDLTIITIDAGRPGRYVGHLIRSGQIKKLIVSHLGQNAEAMTAVSAGTIEAEFVPMGTLVERARCGGMGLGGVLTKTGLGTLAQDGKQTIDVNGTTFLVETALRADIALTYARRADPVGNLAYHGTSKSNNSVFATCADLSIVEVDFLMELNELPLDDIDTPGAFVDMLLPRGE